MLYTHIEQQKKLSKPRHSRDPGGVTTGYKKHVGIGRLGWGILWPAGGPPRCKSCGGRNASRRTSRAGPAQAPAGGKHSAAGFGQNSAKKFEPSEVHNDRRTCREIYEVL